MVLTRSQAHQPIMKKFTDDDFSDEENINPLSPVQPEDIHLSEEADDSDSDSDDAPEEESTSKARSEILLEQKKLQQAEAELKKQEREKRKALDLRNTQQQQLKKSRQSPFELPEFLPDDVASIINQPAKALESNLKPRHIRLDDIEPSPKLDKKTLLEEKLRLLKAKKNVALKKGPVHVKIQSFNSKVVPRSESKIVKNRDKWLHRKSVNRK